MSRILVRAVAGVLIWETAARTRLPRAGAYRVMAAPRPDGPWPTATAPAESSTPQTAAAPASGARLVHGAGVARIERVRAFWSGMLLITAAPVGLAFGLGRTGWYSPGDDVGYNLGLAGGIAMLLLLVYPLRKHVRALRNCGLLKHWFLAHMALGIGGPALILAHSTFHLRSTNAAVALVCMLLVAGSGMVGRFLSTRAHRGLKGETLSLQQLQARAALEHERIDGILHYAPRALTLLRQFESDMVPADRGLFHDTCRLVCINARRKATYRNCRSELDSATAQRSLLSAAENEMVVVDVERARVLVYDYLLSAQHISQLSTYDRLLQFWHLAHLPLVYLLVLSASAHVLAVHMYY
jgi:hypothetical protein